MREKRIELWSWEGKFVALSLWWPLAAGRLGLIPIPIRYNSLHSFQVLPSLQPAAFSHRHTGDTRLQQLQQLQQLATTWSQIEKRDKFETPQCLASS